MLKEGNEVLGQLLKPIYGHCCLTILNFFRKDLFTLISNITLRLCSFSRRFLCQGFLLSSRRGNPHPSSPSSSLSPSSSHFFFLSFVKVFFSLLFVEYFFSFLEEEIFVVFCTEVADESSKKFKIVIEAKFIHGN